MKYLLMAYVNEAAWPKMTRDEQEQGMAAYTAYREALTTAGVLAGSNRLQPSSTATTVRLSNGKSQVLDGPFVESKEQLGGYFLIDVADLSHMTAGNQDVLGWCLRPETGSAKQHARQSAITTMG